MRLRFPVILALAILSGGLPGPGPSRVTAAERPNLIVLMTDDQRADSMSCAGNTILQTPGMDRLAAEGVRFQNMFVTNSLCAPSRATLLTGLYSHKHGVIDNTGRQISPQQPLVSDLLREAGYEVAFCGKSHQAGALRDRQWDYYFGFKGQGNYLRPMIAEGVDGKDQRYDGYMDDVVTDHALRWLENRDSDKPFCLFLWFKAPHRSWLRARRHHDLFTDAVLPKPVTYDEDLRGFPGKPRAFAEADNKIGDFDDVRTMNFIKDYYATLVAVDENVNRLLDLLSQQNQLDETAIMYTSDNGFFHGEWRAFDKRLMHEPSIRVPLLLRYPKLATAGTVEDAMVLNIDIAPTLLDLAGEQIPPWMQGHSVLPLLTGEAANLRDAWLYEYFEYPAVHSVRKHRGVRTDQWKYIHYYEAPEEFELYDLKNDPQELTNLYGNPDHAEITAQLRTRLAQLREETGDAD